MEKNFAKRQMGRIFVNKLCLFLVIIIALGIFACSRGLARVGSVFGALPEITLGAELETLYANGDRYVAGIADYYFDTGYYTTNNNKTDAYFYAMDLEDMYIICKEPPTFDLDDLSYYTIKGRIYKPEYGSLDHQIRSKILTEISEAWGITASEADDYVSPYIIEINANPQLGARLMFGLVAALILLFVFLIISAASRIGGYAGTKQFKRLSQDGEDAEKVNEQVGQELSSPNTYKLGAVTVTKSFFIISSPWSFKLRRKDRACWLYTTVTTHRYNGIPTGKSYAVTVRFFDGLVQSFSATKKNISDCLRELAEQCPNALVGFNENLNKLWNAKDKREFFARRAALYEAQQAENSSSEYAVQAESAGLDEKKTAQRTAARDKSAEQTPEAAPAPTAATSAVPKTIIPPPPSFDINPEKDDETEAPDGESDEDAGSDFEESDFESE
ncbi:MAG: hypothetical protein LBC78_04985 [Oscillospiraceae bacterium]|jgi:hypothetical protein|nr:hypothetical protein [Oscillospiraceae bacterium]